MRPPRPWPPPPPSEIDKFCATVDEVAKDWDESNRRLTELITHNGERWVRGEPSDEELLRRLAATPLRVTVNHRLPIEVQTEESLQRRRREQCRQRERIEELELNRRRRVERIEQEVERRNQRVSEPPDPTMYSVGYVLIGPGLIGVALALVGVPHAASFVVVALLAGWAYNKLPKPPMAMSIPEVHEAPHRDFVHDPKRPKPPRPPPPRTRSE